VGLSSSGQTTYEREYNGGMGSNGLTSARHDVLHNKYAGLFPESFDHRIASDLVYSGNKSLTEPSEIPGINIGKLILSPTRTYAPVINEILKSFRTGIHGMVHCSGGGQTKVLHFTGKQHIVKDNLFTIPPLFRLIQEQSGTEWKEMYRVFNMGHRMELYVPEAIAPGLLEISASFRLDALIIGHVEESDSPRLTISTEHGKFCY